MQEINTTLIPVKELAPGAVAKIRNTAIDQVVALACAELNKTPEQMVVRDIRSYTDLKWATNTGCVTGAISTDTWLCTSDDSKNYASPQALISTTASANVMADERFVCIYGVKDMRMALATSIAQAFGLLKIEVGGNDRVIWDLQNMQAYPEALSSVSNSPVVIPQNSEYQIHAQGCLSDDGGSSDVGSYIVLEGFVVEPMGKVLSP